tara:strand:+ start:859 stop:1095 length:237 start_codon:yes stop_codon:yes gene_type:complete
MKVNRIDVCHETIVEDTVEALVVSIEDLDGVEARTRVHLNYKEEESDLVDLCVMEMMGNDKLKEFFFKVVDLYYEQDL